MSFPLRINAGGGGGEYEEDDFFSKLPNIQKLSDSSANSEKVIFH
jgi:hypothetical protein